MKNAWKARGAAISGKSLAQGIALSVWMTLSACGGGGAEDDAPAPEPIPTVSLSASPATVQRGSAVTLNWSSLNAASCTASGDWAGSRATAGTTSVTPAAVGTATYTLSCDRPGAPSAGSASATVTVTAPPPTVTLAASPTAVTLGAASTLSWSSTDATACTASGAWSGARGVSGSESVTPAAAGAADYTLSCTGPSGSAAATATVTATAAPPPATTTGTLSGRVLNTATGAVLSGATVVAGGLSTTTDGNGDFSLANVPAADRTTVQVSAAGFETSHRIASVIANEVNMLSVLVVPIGATATVMPAAGGEVGIAGSPAMVRFPAGAINSSDPVEVTISDIDPASAPDNMPGDFTTMTGGAEGLIESMGAISVNVRSASGASVPMAAGRTATLRIPLSSLNTSPPASIPLWFYDTAAGRWVQEGTATLMSDASGQFYEGDVAHFTTWNADSLYQSVTITGCVEDNGMPVSGVSVKSTGIDYSGTSTARTGADGRFTIRVRPNSRVTLSGMSGGLVTSTRAISTGSEAQDITASCLQIVREGTAFSIRLSWGERPSDLDSHLYMPQGGQIFYQSRGSLMAEPFVNLDTDDTSSFGPEVVTVLRPRVGIYRYFVKNFSRTTTPGITGSPARVELMAGGMLQLFTPPGGETTTTFNWTVFDITVAADCSTTVTEVSVPWSADSPPLPAAADANAAFCVN